MRFRNQNWVAPIYFILLVIVIAAAGNGLFWASAIAKGLLMPMLMIYIWLNVRPRTDTFIRFIMAALGLSWFGDIIYVVPRYTFIFHLRFG